jgi:hypothetical protein
MISGAGNASYHRKVIIIPHSQSWWWEKKYLEVVEDMGDSDGGYNL